MIQCRLQRADMGRTLGTGHHVAVDVAPEPCVGHEIGRHKALFGNGHHLIRTTELAVIENMAMVLTRILFQSGAVRVNHVLNGLVAIGMCGDLPARIVEFLDQRKQFFLRIEYRKTAKICRFTGQLLEVGLGEPCRIALRATIGKKLGRPKEHLAGLIQLRTLPLFAIAFYQLGITAVGPDDHTDAQVAVFAGLEEKVIHCGAAAIVGRRNPRSGVDHIVTTHGLFILCGRRLGTDG